MFLRGFAQMTKELSHVVANVARQSVFHSVDFS